ncbi:uridine kinase [candidate division Kazan bacterium RIFCSPHIGHO2_01_FULL_49_10]|uniref:uridine/cytidine kinase n=1 Tax=candidate division Kazan bacterium RIFCSPLOWO2_01_FULL_48_13 TaxID=1798539 RepID=A0A1F4PQ20_UNCK3|nr:MAG: uridine kinase [candidate division Kazan bacterium RIFCSPHIGHO2_01_FULL_49_10]OGB85686.1 MAG: uridine kinase [candidate division Kazan bacterium RIFCSPLOWO2_01_FULL_48_13]
MDEPIKPFLIAVAGGTGSGKTYIARKLQAIDPARISIVSHDNYYKDRSSVPIGDRKKLNYDEPAALDNDLFIEQLKQLRKGIGVDMPQYDFSTHTRRQDTTPFSPTPIIIIEGILILENADIRHLFDLKIFIDVDADIRLARRLERDVGERDRTFQESINQYLVSAQPMYDLYVEPGKDFADLIVQNNGTEAELANAIVTIEARVREVLGTCQ